VRPRVAAVAWASTAFVRNHFLRLPRPSCWRAFLNMGSTSFPAIGREDSDGSITFAISVTQADLQPTASEGRTAICHGFGDVHEPNAHRDWWRRNILMLRDAARFPRAPDCSFPLQIRLRASVSRTDPSEAPAVFLVSGPTQRSTRYQACAEGYDPKDRRGKEGITAADVREGLEVIRWSAVTRPMGLLAGMSAGPALASPTRQAIVYFEGPLAF